MLFIPLTRQVADPGYEPLFYLNVDQSLSMVRSTDDTHTRIRGVSVLTPDVGAQSVIEVLVLETPEEIATLINATRAGSRILVTRR